MNEPDITERYNLLDRDDLETWARQVEARMAALEHPPTRFEGEQIGELTACIGNLAQRIHELEAGLEAQACVLNEYGALLEKLRREENKRQPGGW